MELSNRRTACIGTDLLEQFANLNTEGGLQRYEGTLNPRVEPINKITGLKSSRYRRRVAEIEMEKKYLQSTA